MSKFVFREKAKTKPQFLFEKLSHVIDQEFVKFIREICEKFTLFIF